MTNTTNTLAALGSIDLDKLEALLTAAAPAPWTVTEHSWSRIGIYAPSEAVAALDIYDEATEENQAELEARMAANAALIVAARQALPALIALARHTAAASVERSG